MKMVKTVKDKYDVIGLWSMIFTVIGITVSIISFVVTYCNKIFGTNSYYDSAKTKSPLVMQDISVFSAKTILLVALFGGILYQVLNLKKRDDLPMWWALIWFEVFAAATLLVIFFPSFFQTVLNFIFNS
jgi:hypothetical protein